MKNPTRPTSLLATLLLPLWLSGCAVSTTTTSPADHFCAQVAQSGSLICSASKKTSCELSAVAWVPGVRGGELIFGNDKQPDVASESSMFSIPFAGVAFDPQGTKTFYTYPPFTQVRKFESMSVSPDGQHVVAMSAFDRIAPNNASMDSFNVLLAWKAPVPAQAQVVARSQRDGVISSLALRQQLAAALQSRFGAHNAYFKIEGLALLPGGRVVFGVRELGRSYTDFAYQVTLIAGGYHIVDAEFSLNPATALTVVRDFPGLSDQVGRPVGLSSIEYDAAGQRLLLLASYETATAVGAYLWVVPDARNGELGHTPYLVRDSAGAPFAFSHKAEGLAVLNGGRIFVIHDDDRITTSIHTTSPGVAAVADHPRQLNEAAFDILQLGSGVSAAQACQAAAR